MHLAHGINPNYRAGCLINGTHHAAVGAAILWQFGGGYEDLKMPWRFSKGRFPN